MHTHNGQILLYLCSCFRNTSTMRLRKGPPDLCSQIKDLEPCAAFLISRGIRTCRPGRLNFLCTALGGMRFFPQHIDHAATQRSTGPLLPNQRFGALCRIISRGISTCRPGRLNFLCTALGGMRFFPQHIDHAATQRSTGPLLPNQRFGALCRIASHAALVHAALAD